MNQAATPDRSTEYLLVRSLRQRVATISPGIGERTRHDYEKKYERMQRTGFLPEQAGSKKGYYAYRAALLHGTAAEVRDALRQRDRADYGSAAWQAAMTTLQRAAAIFQRYPPDPERRHRDQGSASFTWEGLRAHKQKTLTGWSATIASKKRILSKLRKIPDWREKLFACVTAKHRDAAALCALTGARPSEIAQGVHVALDGDCLTVTLHGSKLTASSGQPERALRLKVECAEARHLAERAAAGPLDIGTHPANLCAALIKAGRAAFPHLRETVSPYVLRHALASDLKAAGIDPEAIAQVLGHRASESQQAYGFAVCASGGVSIEAVRASLPVRLTHRHPRDHLAAPSPTPTLR
jgi:integrase